MLGPAVGSDLEKRSIWLVQYVECVSPHDCTSECVTTVLMPCSIIQLVTYISYVQTEARFGLIQNTEILFAAVMLHHNSK